MADDNSDDGSEYGSMRLDEFDWYDLMSIAQTLVSTKAEMHWRNCSRLYSLRTNNSIGVGIRETAMDMVIRSVAGADHRCLRNWFIIYV